MEPDNQPEQTPQPTGGGYGKRPVWQWVIIYIIVAIVVYGLIYLLFIHKGSGSTSTPGY